MAIDLKYPNSSATERGWGPGWTAGAPIGTRPADYPGKIVELEVRGVSFPGGVREEIHDLVVLLVELSLDKEWLPKLDDPGCWGGAFRPTKRSDGSYTTTPSNHSWYLAVDINAPHNVYGAPSGAIPKAMADVWQEYGFRWLGPAIQDWMHFDFAGTPQDAKEMTAKARRELGDDAMFKEWHDGWGAYKQGDPEPKVDGWKRKGWNDAKFASEGGVAPTANTRR